MVLLGLYIGALIVGGGLLAASSVLGGHHGHDHDAELGGHDHDMDGAEGEVGLHGDPALHSPADAHVATADAIWMPILSLRFWTFFLAFFGLTGALLEGLSRAGLVSGPWFVTLALAIFMGLGSGLAITRILRGLKRESANSGITPDVDYVGKSAEVLLDVGPGDPGLVRLEVKGISIDVKATVPADGARHRRGSKVIVLAWAEGAVQVAPFDTGEPPTRTPERAREPA